MLMIEESWSCHWCLLFIKMSPWNCWYRVQKQVSIRTDSCALLGLPEPRGQSDHFRELCFHNPASQITQSLITRSGIRYAKVGEFLNAQEFIELRRTRTKYRADSQCVLVFQTQTPNASYKTLGSSEIVTRFQFSSILLRNVMIRLDNTHGKFPSNFAEFHSRK